ncbi:MAG: peptidylprolyl isomerase [Frankiales bacterium]|nr:peptidylprolyl isomerase [Frankiales bacterium]
MASNKRERELARMRAERQAARRAAGEARRRRQRQTILAAVAGLAAIAVVIVVVIAVGGSSNKKATLSQTAASATPVASPTAAASPAAFTGSCTYTSSGTSSKKLPGKPPTTGVQASKPVSVGLSTNIGQIDLTLNAAKAPCTVNSFRYLATQKYFDGTSCHRLTTSGIYVLQCGDPTGTGGGGPGYKFADENLTGATYPRGTVAMANAGAGTNGSQFFLVYKDTQLPASYTPFGTITSGLTVLDKVAKAGSNPAGDGKPKLAVTLKTVTAS